MKDIKTLNSVCCCKKNLFSVNSNVIMLEPCEHLMHEKCVSNINICPLCNTKITDITKINDYKKNPKLIQKCIDILSVSYSGNIPQINYFDVLLNIPTGIHISSRFSSVKNTNDIIKLCEDLFAIGNLTIKVTGLNKIKNNDKKIFVANHISMIDSFVLYYVLRTGFLATSSIKNHYFMKNVYKHIPLLLVQRGVKQGMVKKMKEFLNKHGSICIFPEGTLSFPGTVARFRSGAFNIGEPIYPIMLKYNDYLIATDVKLFCLNLFSNISGTIEIKILDPIYPPFNKDTPEYVRKQMEKNGFLLSRVSSKDCIDPDKPIKLNDL